MDKKMIELIELWMPVDEGGEAFDYYSKQNLKLVAILANGVPIKLEKDFMIDKKYITKEEYENTFKIEN